MSIEYDSSAVKYVEELLNEKATSPFQRYILSGIIPGVTYDSEAYRESSHYIALTSEQLPDGSWGRFHTMDSSLPKRCFKTTEQALHRAYDLGLTKDEPFIAESISLMERYIWENGGWSDATEMHRDGGKSFLHAFPYMVAADIAFFDPENTLLAEKRQKCADCLAEAFKGDSFDEALWNSMNLSMRCICLGAWTAYPLWLLRGFKGLDRELERKYLNYIWNRVGGIYYISNYPPSDFFPLESKNFTAWLSSLETLCGFSLFREFMEPEARGFLSGELRRLATGEVALPPPSSLIGRYAEGRRSKEARKHDLMIRILRILHSCE